MRKFLQRLFVALPLLMVAFFSQAQITGTVFKGYNGNGVKDNTASFNEPFLSGITVKAFNASNVQLGTTKTTDAVGAYSFSTAEIPSGTAVRIEFSGYAAGDGPAISGTGNGTNVQFASAPATVNFAVSTPDDYWNNAAAPNPVFLMIAEQRGLASASGYLATQPTVIQATTALTGPYNPADANVAATGTMITVANMQQTGSLFGLAIQRKQQRYFAAAYLRRASEIGTRGPGGIYLFEKSGANFTLTGSFTLQGVTPSNGGAALDFGTVTRVTTPATNDNYISNNGNFPGETRDMDAFAKAGTISYGDIEADPNSDKVYMINLNQKKLIVFNATAATTTLNGATAATLAPFTTAYDILSLPGVPAATGAGNNIRPYAIKIYKGKGYLGVVSDAMTTQNAADLRGYVLQFDPNNIAAGFTTVVTINFDTWPTAATRYWKPWATTWAQAGGSGTTGNRDYPTPIVAGIEFNENGSMDIAIKDRWGDQGGVFEFNPVSGSTGASAHKQCSINGDLLHACWTGTAWALEGTPGSCTQPAGNTNGAADNNSFGNGLSYGNTGLEWYADRSGDGGYENEVGGITKLMGSGLITHTIYDPIGMGENTAAVDGGGSGVYWSTQGIQYSNVTTGAKTQIARVLTGTTNSLDKANGMGDIEFLAEQPPIQVGNRIWLDTNGNGIQDAGETTAGVATGTTVTLRSPGVNGTYGDGDDQTWTTTTNASGNYYFSALSSADNRKPATWAGIGNTLLPGFEYRIEVPIPANNQLSKTDAVLNTFDNIDNDAVQNGANAVIVFNTSFINHDFDIGFKTLNKLGDKVWRDDNSNGTQDAGEPGVAGVTVTLYDNGADGNSNTSDDYIVGTTVTDAYGNYLFDNLANGNYNLSFTLPTNYQFTTSSGTDDVNATNSDANASTGRTGTVVLSGGENELDVDAGLIFSQPSAASIGDRVWVDTNGDGVQNNNEPGMAGVTVTLYDNLGNVLRTTVTDANGNYNFTNLSAGTYSVGFTLPAGFRFTTKDAGGNDNTDADVNTTGVNFGRTDNFVLSAGQTKNDVDAGLIQNANTTASVGDRVWNDVNQNGIQDAGEPGVPGVTITLFRPGYGPDGIAGNGDDNTAIATTVTDGFGYYIFTNVTANTGYQLQITIPGGYTLTTSNAGTSDYTDNDFRTVLANRTDLFTLTAGLRNLTLDAGIYQSSPAGTAQLGNYVWFDANANGTQDASETGVAGVTVSLYTNGVDGLPNTGDDVLTASTTTDADGAYNFVNLAAGNYNVGFSNFPPGYSLTPVWVSNDANATNSDASPFTGRTGTINLTAGEIEPDVDAGLVAGVASGLGSIGNRVWYDLNNNGLQDAGELGVAGATVTLRNAGPDGVIGGGDDGATLTTVTNALGEYQFTGLAAGNYYVDFSTLPSGFIASPSNSGTNDNIDSDGGALGTGGAAAGASRTGLIILAAGEDNLTVDLGINAAGTNSLGNFVWFDKNSNGVQDAGEPGVAGILVTLLDATGNPVDGNTSIAGVQPYTTTTDANGFYLFAGLADGTYSVQFSNLPAGFDLSLKDNDGTAGNGTADSDPDRTNGKTGTVVLNSGNRNDNSLDAGIVTTRAALGNYVWTDLNGDGVQNAAEPGVPGVTVSLYFDSNNDGDFLDAGENLPSASMITDQNGGYLFSNLLPGNYQVAFGTVPSGLSFTQRNTPGDNGNNTNSDADNTGRTATIVLSAAEVDLTIDAGLFKPQATVGNFVWVDVNSNGAQDANEPGLPGVLVTLVDVNSGLSVAVTVTKGDGGYQFANVPPGTYYLQFGNLPSGGSFTNADLAGGNDNLDSDVNPATGRTPNFTVLPTTVDLSFDGGVLTNIAVLPVRIIEFTATPQNNSVVLNWKVGVEDNVHHYEVEYSRTGSSFSSIGNVTASGSSNYSLVHNNPVTGVNYYRIKVVDVNGAVAYSEIRRIDFGKGGEIRLYPNPAKNIMNVTLKESMIGKPVAISIFGADGRIVYQLKQTQAKQTETINISTLASGKYFLSIVSDDASQEVIKTFTVLH